MTTRTTTRTMNLQRRTSVLRFAAGDDAPPDGEYCCRGGICWPFTLDDEAGCNEGFALMCGRNLADGVTYVLGQTHFVCIDHVQDADGKIRFQGLSTWFVDSWAQWFADSYAWRQPYETCRRYLAQVLRSPMIQPKPHLIELDWDRDEDARVVVVEAEATGRLAYDGESPLAAAIEQYKAALQDERKKIPAIHALTCALYSLEAATPRKEEGARR